MEDIKHNIYKNNDNSNSSYFDCMNVDGNIINLKKEQQLMQEIKKVARLIYLNGGHVNPDIRIYINEIYDTKIQELRGTVNNICVGTIIGLYKIAINKEIIEQIDNYAKNIFFNKK
tara:strand:- start:181 stop:528 length:348 start_codon:yes stop_codon:yes gene_type:complete